MLHVIRTANPRRHNRGPRLAAPAVQAVAALAALGAGVASAQAPAPAPGPATADRYEPGFYAGAEIGGTNFDNACDPSALSCDHSDTAAAAFIGYRFDSRFMLEAGAHDLGEATAIYPRLTSTIGVVGEAAGYDLSALLRLPFGPKWETYLRAGAFYWEAETTSPEFAASESDWSPSAGAGFGWQFKPAWQLRLQYLFVADIGGPKTGEANVEMLSAGVLYTFGSERTAPAAAAAASPAVMATASARAAAAPPAAAAASAAAAAPAAPPPLPICPPPLPAWDSNVYFATNSDAPQNVSTLADLRQRLQQRPEATVRLEGSTDASGSTAYNLSLSRRRAQSVADYFRAGGVDESRISVGWAGETQPAAGESLSEALARRVRVTSPALAENNGNCQRAAQ